MKPATLRIAVAATAFASVSAVGSAVYLAWPSADAAASFHASVPEWKPHASASWMPASTPQGSMSLPGTGTAPAAGNLEVLATRLAARLQNRDTEDGDGWALLGRSYVVLGRNVEALAALERARRLLGDSDVQLMADYAAAKASVGAATVTAAGSPATRAR